MDYDQFIGIIGEAPTESCVVGIMFGSGYKFIYRSTEPFCVKDHVNKDLNCVLQHVSDVKGKPVTIYGAISDITHVYIATEPDKGAIDLGSVLR